MENQSLQDFLEEKKKRIDTALVDSLTEIKEKSSLYAAISYSIFSGGKRIRPILLLAACEGLHIEENKALLPAIALEIIHTYSLTHDDLPCMDNSSTRRGKPTVHTLYGEDVALLAGDALLTHAFSLLSSEKSKSHFPATILLRLIQELSQKSGVFGMVEGQAFELLQQHNSLSEDLLHYIDEHKTAALFSAALYMAGIMAESDETTLEQYSQIGRLFGHAFQIADDIQDLETDHDKTNYAQLHGVEYSRQKIREYLQKATDLMKPLPIQNTRISELFSLLEKI